MYNPRAWQTPSTLRIPNIFQIHHHSAHGNMSQDSMNEGYFFAPSTCFGLLSSLILTFPPEYLTGILVPATLGTVEPAVEDTGIVFRCLAVSGARGPAAAF